MKTTNRKITMLLATLLIASAFIVPPAFAKIDINLRDHEKMGGHCIERHVGKSDEALVARLKKDKKISASSTFASVGAAEKIIEKILNKNETAIKKWAKTAKKGEKEVYEGSGSGRGISRKDYNRAIKNASRGNKEAAKEIKKAEGLLRKAQKQQRRADKDYEEARSKQQEALAAFKKDKQNEEKKAALKEAGKKLKPAKKKMTKAKKAVASAKRNLTATKKKYMDEAEEAAKEEIMKSIQKFGKAQVVLKADGKGGYFVLTAYPKP